MVRRPLWAEGGPNEWGVPTFPSRRFVRAGGLTVTHEGLCEYELVDLLTPMKAAAESVLGAGALANASAAAKAALAAIGSVGEDNSEEGDQRDRLATIVTQLHERLRSAVAAVTSYNEALSLVPPLASGGGAKLTAPEEAPKEDE